MKGDITKIYGVNLVGSEDPNALVRTDDAVGLNITVGPSEIISDFDKCYPWSDIEEVTDEFGNVFIKIPKFYSKITEFAGGKYWHQLSGMKHEGFDTLFKIGDKEIDYVMVGKYEGSGSPSGVYSKSGQTPLVQITMDDFRNGCKANGIGYQQYDFLIDLIIKELWLVEMKTTNCQSIMYGYANGNSAPIKTGATDSVTTPSGSPESNTDGNHACKYRGIENPWGNIQIWCDGISFSSEKVYVCADPSSYSAGKTTEPYKYYGNRESRPHYVKIVGPLKEGSLIQYDRWIKEFVDASNSTYFSDYAWTEGTILNCGGYLNYGANAGLWCWDGGSSVSYSHFSIGGRLCYKPRALPDVFNSNRNRINCLIKITNKSQHEKLGLLVFPLAATVDREAFYLQPDSWVDGKMGDLIKDSNAETAPHFSIDPLKLEYLNYPHPFDPDTGEELTSYTHINDSINTKGTRKEIGVCCLQLEKPTNIDGQYNVWTDLKRIQINTLAGPRVVQTKEAAKWDDTKFWVEGWDDSVDTHMVQVKRHPQLTNKILNIDCYMQNIDDLYTGLETCTLSYEDGADGNSGTWYLKKPDDSTYITLKVKQTPKQEGQS